MFRVQGFRVLGYGCLGLWVGFSVFLGFSFQVLGFQVFRF